MRSAMIVFIDNLRWLTPRFWLFGVGLAFVLQPAVANDGVRELIQPPICSAATAAQFQPRNICSARRLDGGQHEVKVRLTAETAPIEVDGYKVTTENYNGNYLTPVIEVMPGDTVAAHLENILLPRQHDGMPHGDSDENPTNLHYFHGGIVSPNNAQPKDARLGNGDN
jgi:FtsP/CotA-like multicopper oxidase with cupredoxin domain